MEKSTTFPVYNFFSVFDQFITFPLIERKACQSLTLSCTRPYNLHYPNKKFLKYPNELALDQNLLPNRHEILFLEQKSATGRKHENDEGVKMVHVRT
jgi:hypothetical protein